MWNIVNRRSNQADNPVPPQNLPPPKRSGLRRIWHAAAYALAGLRAGWGEPAFRQEALLAAVLLPAAFFLGRNWLEVAVLIGAVIFVLCAELLNTAVEAAIDRVGTEWHPLAKKAKDLGAAAVLLTLLLCGGIWLAALLQRWV